MRLFTLILLITFFRTGFCQSPSYEMRGVWIATVSNIDWPSSSKLSKKEQKKEVIKTLDFYKKLNFNTVFIQVRPSADVFFKSKLEPWSKYLTGAQGESPGYDPLKYWIKEAHKRGIEVQAWINPYRITNSKKEKLVSTHPAKLNKDWVIEYGGKMYYNPGIAECKHHIKTIVKEIVEGYDVDGIHMDDYFYPYPIAGEVFPDSTTFKNNNNGFTNIEDWRRNNVNETIKELSDLIKELKPDVEFGVSPFGVWRNQSNDKQGSNTRAGVTNYDHLYADVLTWLKNDWIDYVTPQLYWRRSHPAVSFNVLSEWWSKNSFNKAVYVGHAAYRLNKKMEHWDSAEELLEQIKITRKDSVLLGSVFFSHNHLLSNKLGVADSLANTLYKYPALIPKYSSKKQRSIGHPIKIKINKRRIKWNYKKIKSKAKPEYYAIYGVLKGGVRQLLVLSENKKLKKVDLKELKDEFYGIEITSVYKNTESKSSKIVSVKNWN